MLYRTTFFSEKVWSRSSFIQQDTTRYNKVAKRVQHFVQYDTAFLQKYIQQSTTKFGVAKRVRHHTSSRKTKNVVSYNICLVKSLIAIKRHTTRCKLYNKVAKRVQDFVQHDTAFLQKYIQQSTIKLDGVAKRIRHHPGKQKMLYRTTFV